MKKILFGVIALLVILEAVEMVRPEGLRKFYYLGLDEWRQNRRARLMDVCLRSANYDIILPL